jgi:hypothetical protein
MPDHLNLTARPITTTAAVKRILRAEGLPVITNREWGATPGLLVTSRNGFPSVMVADKDTEAHTLRNAARALQMAGAPVQESFAWGFISLFK